MTGAIILLIGLIGLCSARAQSSPSSGAGAEINAKPLLLEKNEGELRTRRIRTDNKAVPAREFMLKVSPKNNGSQHLVLGTEELAPGAAIPKHRHLDQVEILLIQTGTAHVWLGDQERDVPCGGTGVYSVSYLDQFEEHWDRTDRPDIHFLSAWIRGYDAMQFGGGRRNADCDHSGAAHRVRTPRTCRV